MTNAPIPMPAVRRLSLYLRRLEALEQEGVETVSSRSLGQSVQVTDAQVRKDLAYFGQFGRAGVGYRVGPLIEQLRHILRTDRVWPVVVMGAGDLGRALLRYRGFVRRGFELVAAFDVSGTLIGTTAGGVTIQHVSEVSEVARRSKVKLAVLAVPPEAAQSAAEILCDAGIRGILNFAPTSLRVPPGVIVRQVDLAAHLEQLSFHVGAEEEKA